MNAFKFAKPKNPGFGISQGFYLSVLSTRAVMPSILEAINPRGEGGAVEGFGAPLSSDAGKEVLGRPLERGVYAVTTKDRKTVLKMLVLSKEEAGFDPQQFSSSPLAEGLDLELLLRIRATWTIAQLTFESHDALVYPAVKFLLSFAARLAELSEGCIADPICQRYLLPHDVVQPLRSSAKIDARDVVAIKFRNKPGGRHVYTLGMQKFGLREFEISFVGEKSSKLAGSLLLSLAQGLLEGRKFNAGDRIGAPGAEFQVAEGGLDREFWTDVPCFELLPPTQSTADEALAAWSAATSR